MEFPLCSILIVNYNGKKHLDRCLRSFEQLDYPADRVEILVVDNGSTDGSEVEAQANHPRTRLIRNPKNGYSAALNLGISQAKGTYIAFANNDVFVEPGWLSVLVNTLEANVQTGCAGGKILFENGRINSVGHKSLPNFHWEDEGYNQEDHGQYESEQEVEGLCWAAVLFRRACLDDIGPLDEDYILYYEDVDTSFQLYQRGWKMIYTPNAKAQHVFHGSSANYKFVEYFCGRARLIYVAKFFPEKLADAARTSRFLEEGDIESLYDNLPIIIKKLVDSHPAKIVEQVLEQLCEVLVPVFGNLAVDHLFARMQVILGHRKMSIGFYDQALDVIGGGQKYGCTMAAALQRQFDITLVANKSVGLPDLEKWYRLPLSDCRVKIIPLPYFDKFGSWVDAAVVTDDVPNPFEAVAAQSKDFDIFVVVNMLPMVRPLSPFSAFICHFPDTPRRCYFAVDGYSAMIANSRYTAHWIKQRWNLETDLLLYPPVRMEAQQREKENLILSAARFEVGGTKKQREMIQAFESLWNSHRDLLRDWRLVLVGGSIPRNPYLKEVEELVQRSKAPVELRVNVPFTEIQDLYARAKIFWHACGLGETNPHYVEHFGMTTVEAMQNRCVPVVIDGGGQREIVEHGRSGYRFSTVRDLCNYTLKLIADPGSIEQLREAAYQRSQAFTQERFEETVNCFFRALEEEYRSIYLPDPAEIMRNQPRTNLFYSPIARQEAACLQQANFQRVPGSGATP